MPPLQQGKLLAPRILPIGKVLAYVANKLNEQSARGTGEAAGDADGRGGRGGASPRGGRRGGGADAGGGAAGGVGVNTEDGVARLGPGDLRLWCNGTPLTPAMSLMTVRQHVWKRSDDIVLKYERVQ